jgi:hypothetical protein
MPRYYFDIDDGSTPDGIVLKNIAEAKCEAVKLAGHVICEAAGEFWDRAEWNLTVTGEDGLTLFTLHLIGVESAAVQTRAMPRPASG